MKKNPKNNSAAQQQGALSVKVKLMIKMVSGYKNTQNMFNTGSLILPQSFSTAVIVADCLSGL